MGKYHHYFVLPANYYQFKMLFHRLDNGLALPEALTKITFYLTQISNHTVIVNIIMYTYIGRLRLIP